MRSKGKKNGRVVERINNKQKYIQTKFISNILEVKWGEKVENDNITEG